MASVTITGRLISEMHTSRLEDYIDTIQSTGLQKTVTYSDDVVSYSSSQADNMEHIRQGVGLVINLLKCEIRKGQFTYLGHQLGQGSVRTQTGKFQAILDLPIPKSKYRLKSFLDMCDLHMWFCTCDNTTQKLVEKGS